MFAKYLSIPYVYRGRTFAGCDCYGLVMLYFRKELGIGIKDFFADRATSRDIAEWEDDWLPVSIGDVKPNDVLLLKNLIVEDNAGDHVGIVIDSRHFLHALNGAGCAVSKISSWKHRMVAAYRHRRLVE